MVAILSHCLGSIPCRASVDGASWVVLVGLALQTLGQSLRKKAGFFLELRLELFGVTKHEP